MNRGAAKRDKYERRSDKARLAVLSGFSATRRAAASALQTLAIPDLITAAPGATASILDLVIASTDGTLPPVSLDVLGVLVTTGDVNVELSARTGDGQILGNLLYNVSNLLNSGSSASTLLALLGLLAR